jgi:NADPH:quinone reductase-like Zn-dependent oxidoreductase
MKAVVRTAFGPPEILRLQEVDKPVPGDDQVLIKVEAVSLNRADKRMLVGDPAIMRLIVKPSPILGADVAGRVESVGRNVRRLQLGDAVYGDLALWGFGGLAEYVCASEDALALKPANLTFEQAAAVPMAAVTALQGLRDKGKIQPGQKVLIDGASGGVGVYAVQIARAFGAEVTAVCSPRNLEQARALGADQVIDYTQEDFTQNGRRYDLILAANGYHPLLHYRRALAPNGTYVMTGGGMKQLAQALLFGPLVSRTGTRKMMALSAHSGWKDLLALKELIEAGKIVPVIDRCYPLSEAQDAFRYLGAGHARGKIVIVVA